MKCGVGIGVSNLEFFNILLSYYPKNLNEDFKFFLFIDTNKLSISSVKNIIKKHDISIFNNAEYISIPLMYEYYEHLLNLKGKSKKILYEHGALFKALMPDYLYSKFGIEKTYSSDDDVFIFDDLTNTFNNYKGFSFKKDTTFTFKTSKKYEFLNAFNEIFESEFSLKRVNNLSLNSGNILSMYHPKLIYFFNKFINHPTVHHMFFDFKGYTKWTTEQRFQQFWMHWLIDENKYDVNLI